jgi:tungstate transport system permease protein
MDLFWEGILRGFQLLFGGDPEVWEITLLSLKVSGLATGISLLLGLPLGTWLALGKPPG